MKYINGTDGIFHYVPGELSYDHFDKSGKISIWKLSKLVEASRAAWMHIGPPAYWRDHSTTMVFLRSQYFKIHPAFYEMDLSQSPSLKMALFASYFGKTSYCLDLELRNLNTNELLAMSSCHVVLVSRETRRPTPLPPKALQYTTIIPAQDKRPVPDPVFPACPSGCFTQKRIVMPSDTDTNQHLNQASFIHYCFDCASMAALDGALPSFSDDVIYSFVKSLWIVYLREARVGQELRLSCWEDDDLKHTIWIEVGHKSQILGHCQVQFYGDGPKSSVFDLKEAGTTSKL